MQLITPRQFCRIYFGLVGLPDDQIEKEEQSHGYKTRCADALAYVLGMSRSTLINSRFCKELEFEGLRNNHQARLFLTVWVIQKYYPDKIHHLEQCVRELIAHPQSRDAA
jgi:hypothetical protein